MAGSDWGQFLVCGVDQTNQINQIDRSTAGAVVPVYPGCWMEAWRCM